MEDAMEVKANIIKIYASADSMKKVDIIIRYYPNFIGIVDRRMFLRVLIHLIMHDYPPLVSGALQLLFKHFSQRQEVLHTFKQVRHIFNRLNHTIRLFCELTNAEVVYFYFQILHNHGVSESKELSV